MEEWPWSQLFGKENCMRIWMTDIATGKMRSFRTPRVPTILPEYWVGEEQSHAWHLTGKKGERKHQVAVGCNEKDIKRVFSRYKRSHQELHVVSGHLRKAWTFQRTHSHEWVFLVETDQSYPNQGMPVSTFLSTASPQEIRRFRMNELLGRNKASLERQITKPDFPVACAG